jgi:hypothetical protein
MQISPKQKMITIEEYCKKIDPLLFRLKPKHPHRKITRQAVYYRISNDMELPLVQRFVKNGSVYFLILKKDF